MQDSYRDCHTWWHAQTCPVSRGVKLTHSKCHAWTLMVNVTCRQKDSISYRLCCIKTDTHGAEIIHYSYVTAHSGTSSHAPVALHIVSCRHTKVHVVSPHKVNTRTAIYDVTLGCAQCRTPHWVPRVNTHSKCPTDLGTQTLGISNSVT